MRKLFLCAYFLIVDFLFLISFPVIVILSHFSSKIREEVLPRFIPSPLDSRFILHGSSAGEVRSLIPIALKLKAKGESVRFTSTTLRGKQIAERYGFSASLLPIESFFSLKRFYKGAEKVHLIIGERDIWLRFIKWAKTRGGKVVMVGVLFPKLNLRRKLLLRFVKPYIDVLFLRDEGDFRKLSSMNIPVRRGGNLKVLAEPSGKSVSLRRDYILFSCLHREEYPIIRNVCVALLREFPNLSFVIAPRYVEESEELKKNFPSEFKVKLLSEKEEKWDVLLVDKFGVLPHLYRGALAVFIGGSFVKKGGHDLLDACRWGIPVFIGPHYWNQRDVVRILLRNGGVEVVNDEKELSEGIKRVIKSDRSMGEKARECYKKLKESAERTVEEVVRLCGEG